MSPPSASSISAVAQALSVAIQAGQTWLKSAAHLFQQGERDARRPLLLLARLVQIGYLADRTLFESLVVPLPGSSNVSRSASARQFKARGKLRAHLEDQQRWLGDLHARLSRARAQEKTMNEQVSTRISEARGVWRAKLQLQGTPEHASQLNKLKDSASRTEKEALALWAHHFASMNKAAKFAQNVAVSLQVRILTTTHRVPAHVHVVTVLCVVQCITDSIM